MNNNTKINTIIDSLKSLTLLEISILIKLIEETFGITSINSNITFESNKSIISEESIKKEEIVVEEKNSFSIILNEVPTAKKIPILKIIRNITGYGLKESKEIIDSVPKLLKEGLSKVECEQFKKELEAAGAQISIK